MFGSFSRYALAVIGLLFVAVFCFDYWYQQRQAKLPELLHDSISSIVELCKLSSCEQYQQFDKVMLVPSEAIHFSPLVSDRLKQGELVSVQDEHGMSFIYAFVPQRELIVQYGPYHNKDAIPSSYYTLAFYSFLALAIAVGLFPLFREMFRLQKAAEHFSKTGDLSRLIVDKANFFKPVSTALSSMHSKIARLLALQKELSDILSHEVRTPLARIRFAKEALSEQTVDFFKVEVEKDIEEIEELVAEHLTFSRLEHDEPTLDLQKASPVSLLEHHVSQFNRFTRAVVEFRDLTSGSATLVFDEKKLSRAVKNIIDNACKYAKSKVLVSLAFDESNEKVIVSIEDDGQGIASQDVDDLFLPYTRLSNNTAEGFGLGLAITNKIIIWHNGKINVTKSEKLGGAKFELIFTL